MSHFRILLISLLILDHIKSIRISPKFIGFGSDVTLLPESNTPDEYHYLWYFSAYNDDGHWTLLETGKEFRINHFSEANIGFYNLTILDKRFSVNSYDLIKVDVSRDITLKLFLDEEEALLGSCDKLRNNFNITLECIGDPEVLSGSFSHVTDCTEEEHYVTEEKAVLKFGRCQASEGVGRLEFRGICEGHQNVSRILCFTANSACTQESLGSLLIFIFFLYFK